MAKLKSQKSQMASKLKQKELEMNFTNSSKKIELLSINYLVDGNEYIARKDMTSNRGIVSVGDNDHLEAFNGSTPCGPDCKCVNGFVQRLVNFGGIPHWMPTNEPC